MKNILKFLHGEHFTITDLLFTYFAASLSLILILVFVKPIEVSIIKNIVLSFIILDFSGGAIANLTNSTSVFYASRPNLQKLFILAHIVQPIFLAWIFQKELIAIALTTIYTLLCSIVISSLSDFNKQRALAMLLLLLGIISLLLIFKITTLTLTICLIFYMIKLIFSFPINWGSTVIR